MSKLTLKMSREQCVLMPRQCCLLAGICISRLISDFTCEVLFLSAPHPDSGQTIALIGAFYGRTDRTTCIYGVPDGKFKDITCFTPTANQTVAERCHGKSSCTFHAKKSKFEEPCRETSKYMELAYKCECKQHEGVISVLKVAYGRTDRQTCSEGRPPAQLANTAFTCSSTTATSTVAKSCDGKRRCTVYALNSKFGDPCYGTFKYLELAYTCGCKQRFLQCRFSLLEFSLLAF
uniref:SUEL-type lectin domain-containing protein n=1 Tax=Gadus morhua TaxID=8049 RepID=A0A8C5AI64_GADMO